MTARLRIVTGKGGVGKTTVACSIALAAARSGLRVLLAETHAQGAAASLLGVKPTGPAMREVLENLYLVDLDPQEAIHEYALLVLKFETVYRAVFGNRLVRGLVNLVPSLGELTMLGKLWYHEQEREADGSPRFDLLVLDAPATGHAISMLRTPGAVADTVPKGALRDNCLLITDLLCDPARTEMHIVTTPEEMPVNEAMELERAAAEMLNIRLGAAFINGVVSPLPEEALAALSQIDAPDFHHVYMALRIRQDKVDAGQAHLNRLPAHLREGALELPRVVGERFGLKVLGGFADELKPVAHERQWW